MTNHFELGGVSGPLTMKEANFAQAALIGQYGGDQVGWPEIYGGPFKKVMEDQQMVDLLRRDYTAGLEEISRRLYKGSNQSEAA